MTPDIRNGHSNKSLTHSSDRKCLKFSYPPITMAANNRTLSASTLLTISSVILIRKATPSLTQTKPLGGGSRRRTCNPSGDVDFNDKHRSTAIYPANMRYCTHQKYGSQHLTCSQGSRPTYSTGTMRPHAEASRRRLRHGCHD